MASFVVTGASRGIGLELVRQLLTLPAVQVGRVFALSRGDDAPLKGLVDGSKGRAHHIIAAVDDDASIAKAVEAVRTHLGAGEGVDVLVNNAGVHSYTPGGVKDVTPAQLADVLAVNVGGVQRVTAAFLPLLEAGSLKRVVNVSSSTGSLTLAKHYAFAATHAYRISKTALNMLTAQWACDFADRGFTFLAVSPGWLKTDLGGQKADLEPAVGVAELRRIMLEATRAQNGKFVNIHVPGWETSHNQYDGKEIPW